MRRAQRTLTFVGGSALALSLLAGCAAAAPSSEEPVAGGTLVYATGDAEPSCLDPHVGGNYPQALLATQYIESLVSKNADGDIIPWLAESWEESDDGLSWEFRLRDDVSFTDGTPLTADAVAANIAHLKDPETASSTGYLAVGKIESTTSLDEHTLRIDLSAPDSALLDSFSMPWVGIQSPTALERGEDANCESPVGTGPFIVEEWTRQQGVRLVRNEDYNSWPQDAAHEGTAWLEAIDWRFIPDAATRYAALQSGEVDVIDNPQPNALAAASEDGPITAVAAPRPGASNRIELNAGKAPFDDARVREAFIRAAKVNDGIEGLFFGTVARSYSVLSSVEADSLSTPEYFDADLDAANALLDAAGWTQRDADGYRVKDGQRLVLEFPVSTNQSVPAEQSLFEQIQATAKQAGFQVILEPLDLSSWYGALAAHEYNLVSAPYTKVGPDVLRILYHSDSTVPAPSGYFANLAQLKDPKLDALLTQASETTDATLRAELYEEAQDIVLSGYHVLPLYDQQNHYLHGEDVEGMRALPTVSTPTFFDAWLSR
ncbi:ABC transporter substrate-binding protein [Salinibacterium sp. dk2585]|uniref:ABC transporter substrate-binding protein n=1 Tax=unclassified Salinibacterium TaxID=2632331 RepID=UPI0011C24B19|nr:MULTISPECIES: ABC transporter substrate-binding protein [unclassified Salinibacterium]QEE61458.1 ABC transporter substrate-binding protein [Salinibacterium sp. dk2585]TXK54135.1 ABC transporter substrate-binding protein [Salinibacterium sp. dk5596]